MKKIFFTLLSLAVLSSCSMTRRQNELIQAQQELIDQYEAVLDTIYKDQNDYFLDVLMETDVYYEYTVKYNHCKSLQK